MAEAQRANPPYSSLLLPFLCPGRRMKYWHGESESDPSPRYLIDDLSQSILHFVQTYAISPRNANAEIPLQRLPGGQPNQRKSNPMRPMSAGGSPVTAARLRCPADGSHSLPLPSGRTRWSLEIQEKEGEPGAPHLDITRLSATNTRTSGSLNKGSTIPPAKVSKTSRANHPWPGTSRIKFRGEAPVPHAAGNLSH
jgi:hypothetical protein